MKTVKVKIIGVSPLMQHRMPIETLFGLMASKAKRKTDKIEETPRQVAQRHVYQRKNKTFYVPAEYIVGAFKDVAGDYKQGGGSKKSVKAIAAGVFKPTEGEITILDKKWKAHKDFEVDIRKGTNHTKGAVAICRPRFDEWALETHFEIDDQLIAIEIAQQILEDAGRRAGIGSFRVSKGGYFGQFRIEEFKIIK